MTLTVPALARPPQRRSSAEWAADVLREWITQGLLRPGARLGESTLTEALGVSRNTLREALRLLGHERLVRHELNRGVSVATLDADDVADLFRVRQWAEIAGLQCWPGADGSRPRLRRAVEEGAGAVARGEWDAVATADLDFHRAITALAGSRRLDELMGRVLAELRLAFAAVPDPASFHRPFLRRNAELCALLEEGRREHAERELTAYLADARDHILGALDRSPGRG